VRGFRQLGLSQQLVRVGAVDSVHQRLDQGPEIGVDEAWAYILAREKGFPVGGEKVRDVVEVDVAGQGAC